MPLRQVSGYQTVVVMDSETNKQNEQTKEFMTLYWPLSFTAASFDKAVNALGSKEAVLIVQWMIVRLIHSSEKLQSPPLSVLFCSCDKVYHKQNVRFLLYLLGLIVTWQSLP